jgi:UDP:flavonoid glycosyltransferase YjiC (YdhE family)
MRLLFTTTQGLGHAMSLLPFARAARDGHDVVLAGPAPIEAVAAGAGLVHAELAWPDEEPLAVARRRVAELDGVEKVRAAIGDLFVTTYGGTALSSTLALVEGWRPDVIVHETAEASAPIAGQLHGVPTIRVSVALATRSEARWLSLAGPALDGLRARVGLAADPGAERLSRTPLLTRAPSALDVGEGDPPPDVRRFRHEDDGDAATLSAWWPGPAGDAPLVPISFGTVIPIDGHYPGVYRDAIEGVADLPVRILVTVGRDADPAALGALPPNVHVERWVSIPAVLRSAAVLVTHGGTGTTLAALAAGVPMALLPISADQPRNARLVAELGAGIALESGPADAPRLGDAVRTLLDDDRYRRVAQRVAAEIRELPPVTAAVEQLEDLAGSPGLSPAKYARR